jgi:hypothetical protein
VSLSVPLSTGSDCERWGRKASLAGSGLVVNWSAYLTVGCAVHPGQGRGQNQAESEVELQRVRGRKRTGSKNENRCRPGTRKPWETGHTHVRGVGIPCWGRKDGGETGRLGRGDGIGGCRFYYRKAVPGPQDATASVVSPLFTYSTA